MSFIYGIVLFCKGLASNIMILISLGHFCDIHGPTIIIVTQEGEIGNSGNELLLPDYPTESYCESCMVKIPDCDGSDENGADVDTEAEVSTTDTISENTLLPASNVPRSIRSKLGEKSFVSSQYSAIRYQLLTSMIRKAFSEETMIYDGSPSVFYDESKGLNLVMGFKLHDPNARGNERRYCLILTIESVDETNAMGLIAAHWHFIVGGFSMMINAIKEKHAQNNDGLESNHDLQKNFTQDIGNYLRANKGKCARNLSELTNDKYTFLRIHKWNTYMIDTLCSKLQRADQSSVIKERSKHAS